MHSTLRASLYGLTAFVLLASPLRAQEIEARPPVVLGGLPFSLTLKGAADGSSWYEVRTAQDSLLRSGTVEANESLAVSDLAVESRASLPIEVRIGEVTETVDPYYAPSWYSIVPPLVAIALALLFREVLAALFAGVWLGALAVTGFNPLNATWRTVDTFIVPALADDGGQTQIVVFSLLLGGMVGVIARNGGTLGIVEAVSPFATSARRGKIATWLAGLAIFFDDYANTLIVGTTMRPITDRLRISREKLAYIVDSTAAPVAALVPISTWVGYEISLIDSGLQIAAEQQASIDPALSASLTSSSAFAVFLSSIPYLFYPLLALAFVFLTSVMNRDFGEMAVAEKRAAAGGGLTRPGSMPVTDTTDSLLQPVESAPHRWWNAAIPVLTVVVTVLIGLLVSGRAGSEPGASLMDVLGAADPYATLLWGSLAGCLMGVGLSLVQRILTLQEALGSVVAGMKAMMIAMIVLVLAWSLGAVTGAIGTAAFLAQTLGDSVPLQLIPVLVFVTAAAMAFATGTSWATMAILLPLVIPLTVSLGGGVDFDGGAQQSILLGSISSVLAGAIFGDHCSPISDTTVLSSTASGCDHVDHVRTQLPYAVVVAVVGMLLGDIGTAYGLPVWVALGLGVLILFAVLRLRGTSIGEPVIADDVAAAAAAPVP